MRAKKAEQRPYESVVHRSDEFRRLTQTLGRISKDLSVAVPNMTRVADGIAGLLVQLVVHFRREQAGGCFRGVLNVAPRLEHEAHELEKQHARYLDEFGRLQSLAEDLLTDRRSNEDGKRDELLERLVRDFAEARLALEEHEKRERALFQDAFETDVGAGD